MPFHGRSIPPYMHRSSHSPDAVQAITDEAKELAQNGDMFAVIERLEQPLGRLRANGQFNTLGTEQAEWAAMLKAGENP